MVNEDGIYNQFKRNWKNFLYGMFLATIINIGAVIMLSPSEVEPYRNVERQDPVVYNVETNTVEYVANFYKGRDDCAFEVLIPYAIVVGENIPLLKWHDLHGRGQNDNREKGEHTLALEIFLEKNKPEEIEIRTRHKCVIETGKDDADGNPILGTKKVTKVFDRFEVPY